MKQEIGMVLLVFVVGFVVGFVATGLLGYARENIDEKQEDGDGTE